MKRFFPFILAFLFFFSCSAYVRTNKDPGVELAPTQDIQILDRLPSCPYRQIGTVEGFMAFNYGEMLEKMKQKGKAMGADALVLIVRDFDRATALAIKYEK